MYVALPCSGSSAGFAMQGFAVASADGALSLYEKDADETRMYHAARRLPMDGGADVLGQGLGIGFGAAPRARSLALTAAEDALLLTLASRQLLSLNLGAAELAKVGKPWNQC